MKDSGIETAAKQPHDIAKQRQATAAIIIGHDLFPKGPYYETRDLKTLKPPGYPHNGNAQRKPANDITDGGDQSAKNQPDEIA